MARPPKAKNSESSTANIGFGAKLWLAADKLRNNMDAAVIMPQKASESFVAAHFARIRWVRFGLDEWNVANRADEAFGRDVQFRTSFQLPTCKIRN